MILETRWTLGFIIGTPIWILVLLATLTLIVIAIRARVTEVWVGASCALALFVAIILSPLGYYPYKAEYHQWRSVDGVVQEVGKRLIAQDKAMSERYVLKINGQAYGVDDTRASLVKVGDRVSLSCKRDWQYASVPGYVCRWNQ